MPDAVRIAALFAIGALGGVVGSVVSLATLVSFPALVALGMPPITANATNTVALTFTGIGSVLRSREELTGLARTTLRLAPISVVGGVLGAVILLSAPARTFELIVPVLIAVASTLMLVQPRLAASYRFRPRGLTPATVTGLLGVAVYTGYFGAAGGVLLMVALGWVLEVSVVRRNAVKNALAAVANGVAALVLLRFGPVELAAVPPLAVGFLAGGLAGPGLSRRLGDDRLRLLIFGCGLTVACALAWRAYR